MESPVALIRKAIKSHQELSRFIMWIVVGFVIMIFFVYPIFLKLLFSFLEGNESDKFNRGTFGDMYGALNAFLSGLAFIGAVIAIILQVYQINEERQKRKGETIVELNLFKWHLDKLKSKYLKHLRAYLNWNGASYSSQLMRIDFNDDYSFKELLGMNILDLYRGFVAIGKIEQAGKLIEFIQLLKQIHEFYSGARKFRSDCENSIQNAKGLVVEKGKILSVELKLSGVTAFNSEIHDFINDISDRLQDLDSDTIEVISNLTQYIDYSNELTTYQLERDIYNFEIENRLDKITEIETLIDNIRSNIPTMNSSV